MERTMRPSIFYLLSSILYPLSSKKLGAAFLALCLLVVMAGCGANMRDQTKCAPYQASAAFADGKCMRQPPENTVARGLDQEEQELSGVGANGQPAAEFPFPITRDVLTAGQTRYEQFCSPCHGLSGYGDGMIVQRGFPAPPSFHTQRLRDVPPGYIYGVITNGFGRMFSYGYRVKPQDRWAIIAYIRALQLSQNATLDDVPPQERQQLQGTKP